LVFQSRSGPPTQAWLEPDICDHLTQLKEAGTTDVIIAPVGFISDHMEVLYDLDTEARALCEKINLNMVRASTVGAHPAFVHMIHELIKERMNPETPRLYLGTRGASHDLCPADCCLMNARPASA
jgi:ferrochelatase